MKKIILFVFMLTTLGATSVFAQGINARYMPCPIDNCFGAILQSSYDWRGSESIPCAKYPSVQKDTKTINMRTSEVRCTSCGFYDMSVLRLPGGEVICTH